MLNIKINKNYLKKEDFRFNVYLINLNENYRFNIRLIEYKNNKLEINNLIKENKKYISEEIYNLIKKDKNKFKDIVILLNSYDSSKHIKYINDNLKIYESLCNINLELSVYFELKIYEMVRTDFIYDENYLNKKSIKDKLKNF